MSGGRGDLEPSYVLAAVGAGPAGGAPAPAAVLSDNAIHGEGLCSLLDRVGRRPGHSGPASCREAHLGFKRGCRVILLDVGAAQPSEAMDICDLMPAGMLRVLGVSCDPFDPPALPRLMECGLAGYANLAAGPAPATVLLASVLSGRPTLDLSTAGSGVSLSGPWGSATRSTEIGPEDLAILEMMSRGLRDADIGERLSRSPSNVKHRIEAMMSSRGLITRFELGRWVNELGYLRKER